MNDSEISVVSLLVLLLINLATLGICTVYFGILLDYIVGPPKETNIETKEEWIDY